MSFKIWLLRLLRCVIQVYSYRCSRPLDVKCRIEMLRKIWLAHATLIFSHLTPSWQRSILHVDSRFIISMNTSLINSTFISYVVKSHSHFEITSNAQQPFFHQYMILAIRSVWKRQTIAITYRKNLNAFPSWIQRWVKYL